MQRRGGGLLLSTLDWALIETWKNAGIPLEAVLRGIDEAFDKYEQRPTKTKKVNSLAYCSQAVLGAAEDIKEAAVGAEPSAKSRSGEGFEPDTVTAFLLRNAELLESAKVSDRGKSTVRPILLDTAKTLRQLADETKAKRMGRLEDLERRLTVLEDKVLAMLLTSTADEEIVAMRAQSDRDLMPYRSKMSGAQIDQLQKQYVQKRLLEKYRLPRLSLFYM